MLQGAWQTLALAGAGMGLVALALYFHPIYLAAIAINVAILLVMPGVVAPAR